MTKVDSGLARLVLMLLCAGLTQPILAAENEVVTLRLQNGDQLTGQVISQNEEQITFKTTWNFTVTIPRNEITSGLPESPAQPKGIASSTNSPTPPAQVTIATNRPLSTPTKLEPDPTPSAAAKVPKHWKWNLKLGTDFIQGAKNREIYFGQTSLIYTRNYKSNPKKFLRNRLEYSVDYGETDGDVSANRMIGANKLDFDVFDRFYGYGALGAGYDTVRKIAYQMELGPGIGYHLVARKGVALDTEMGINYQYREGLDNAPDREVFQGRLGQELTWEVVPKITLTEMVAFLPFLDEFGEYQVRFEGNLGFGIVRHLSLNLTVLNFYDTQPAPGVPNNEFQFRSSLGVNF